MTKSFSPPDPDFEARCRDSFARQGAMGLIGASIGRIDPGYCELLLPYRPELSQQHGFFHAGIIATLADSAGGYAGFSLMPRGAAVLAVEFKINLMAPGKGDLLIARGQVLKAGRTLTICNVTVAALTNDQETDCAVMQQTLICLMGRETPG